MELATHASRRTRRTAGRRLHRLFALVPLLAAAARLDLQLIANVINPRNPPSVVASSVLDLRLTLSRHGRESRCVLAAHSLGEGTPGDTARVPP